jgi:methionine synthase II (cobalamin-independent)
MSLKSTVVGPYPRVGSKCGDSLRKEINKLYEGTGDAERVGSLKVDLTREVVQEMVSAGIEVPNYGLVDVHDELTWPLEHVAGIELRGMKKIFHTNTHYKEAVVTGEIRRKHSLLSDLYNTALQVTPNVKVEFPGPYTMARHSILGKGSPYKNLNELAEAYSRLYREELSKLKGFPFVQFNEPSVVSPGTKVENVRIMQDMYSNMLNGLNVSAAVWTFYGKCPSEVLEILFSLPVDVVGLDLVWDPGVADLIRNHSKEKGIGFGVIDSGDQGRIQMEDQERIVERLSSLRGHVNFDKSFISCNATLEHLPRDYAKRKAALIGEVTRRMNK